MTTTNYIWDEQNYLAEADETNTINVVYTNEPQQYGNLISTRLPVSGTPTTVYHHFDALGSTRQLSTTAGAVSDTVTYDAWGNVVIRSGTTAVTLLWIGELGYYFDPETGLVYVRARIYGPAIARWTAFDPFGVLSQLNLHVYAANRPIEFADPSGLVAFKANMVAKSYIKGPNPVGAIVPDRGGLPPPAGFPNLPTATARLIFLGKFVGIPPFTFAFNQDPKTDAKDQTYRLYTRVDISFDCCNNTLSLISQFGDSDGGIEVPPTVYGTINLDGPQVTRSQPSTMIVIWRGWGRPNLVVEPGMQWVATRTSVNIWHKAEVWLTCNGNQGNYDVKAFTGSKFPSRKLWVEGQQAAFTPQGTFSDLWNPDAADPTFVA